MIVLTASLILQAATRAINTNAVASSHMQRNRQLASHPYMKGRCEIQLIPLEYKKSPESYHLGVGHNKTTREHFKLRHVAFVFFKL